MWGKRGKYGNKKTMVNGHKFDSILESEVYIYLLADKTEVLDFQPKVHMSEAGILYKPDFRCRKNGKVFYVEAKGFETAVWKLKKRLWMSYGPSDLHVYKSNGKGIYLSDTLVPNSTY
jgi:hypothetical protein